MRKNTRRFKTPRNELLAEMSNLLREQNSILKQVVPALATGKEVCTAPFQNDESENFIENIDHDEMRDGFLVTSQRKKLWNVQINLVNEFARICKKHNIRWFAGFGTLLGAARHKGFIPWDDDIDLLMFRPDYEKFKLVAATEIKEPFFFDNWYNYRLESEGASLSDPEGDFQFLTNEQEKVRGTRWLTQWPSIRLRDSRTFMFEFPDRNFVNQGIWIDIFPLDPVPPFTDETHAMNFDLSKVLLLAAAAPEQIRSISQTNPQILLIYNELKNFLVLPYVERGRYFDNLMNKNFFMSERIGDIRSYTLTNNQIAYSSKDFADVIYLPFEKIEVPAPAGYTSVLQSYYGDWRKPVYRPPHVQIYSTEISWREYFQKTLFK